MDLQEILKAQGLNEEALKKVAEEMKKNKIYTSSEENLDIRYGKLKADFEALEKKHGEANTLIEEMKKSSQGNETLQSKLTEYETKVQALETELEKSKLENAVKVALLSAKATDIDYLTFKLKEEGELKLDEKGEISGIKDKLDELKTKFPNQFESSTQKKIDENKLPDGNPDKKISKEDFAKMGYQERLKVFDESPELYNELTGKKEN
ncbi:MAG: phage scaffolding protein [Candidatus Fimenecus sp.]